MTSQHFECSSLESHSLAKKKSSSRDGDSGARSSGQDQPSGSGEGNSGDGVNKGGCGGGERDEASCHGKNNKALEDEIINFYFSNLIFF